MKKLIVIKENILEAQARTDEEGQASKSAVQAAERAKRERFWRSF